jgi:rod shape-determining protein MreC
VSSIKHRFFIVCLSIALAVALFSGVFAVMGWGSLLSEVGSAILYPFQWVGAKVGYAVTGFAHYFQDMEALQSELDSLKAENESLRGELLDAEILADEQAWLYHYLSVKEQHGDYTFCAASVIAKASASGEGGDYITELTLNKGTSSGVQAGMPVITPAGLVGVVVEAGLSHCRVSTLLDTSVSVGAVTTRASENGLCEGDHAVLHEGCATLRNLSEEADVEAGDIVVTSGRGSVYPYGIPIGRVVAVTANAYSRTTEATVEPFTDFTDLTQVVIMTDFVHYVDGYEPPSGGQP